MQLISRPILGVTCVVGAAALWGTTGTSQSLAGGYLPALWFGALRLLFAALFFTVFAAISGGLARRAWQGLPLGAAFGAGLCMAAYNLAFFAGVKLTGVGVGTAIALGSGPIWAGLLQAVFQRQPPTTAWWGGTTLAISGVVLLSTGGSSLAISALGVGLCMTSGLSYALYTLLNKRMVNRAPTATITLAAFSVAVLVAVPAAALQTNLPSLSGRDIAAVAYTGIVTAGVGYLLFSTALHHIQPATAVSLVQIEPVVAFALAVLLLGEPASMAALCGLALVVVGVLGVARSELSFQDSSDSPARP
ncbi:MAG: EamA/RhaT family transporter [Polaromonas sp.]|nr:MAG: EamA/RhaT family transporter [Polaromonas sp.]